MIKINETYSINGGQGTIVFSEGKKGTVNASYEVKGKKDTGVINGTLDGNVLNGTYHNKIGNSTGLIQFVFTENGFDCKWKQGLEPGPMRGKWDGVINTMNDIQISITPDITKLLQEKLIRPTTGLIPIYNSLKYYFNQQYGFINDIVPQDYTLRVDDLVGVFSYLQQKVIRTVGIDFPIYLSKGRNRPILMICALDPLREEDEGQLNPNIISDWVPFSIINNLAKATKHTEKENLIFFHTLLEKYDLYVTDVYKIFFREGEKNSNSISSYTSLAVHNDILHSEIDLVKPSAILTLGNDARDVVSYLMKITPPKWSDTVDKTNVNGIDVIMVPHISGTANGAKSPILKNFKFSELPGENNEKYARIITHVLGS